MENLRRKIVAVIAMVSALILSAISFADITPSNLVESVTVQANCRIVGGVVSMSFGSYDPSLANITQDLDATSSFSVRCTPGTIAVISMDSGQNASGGMRRMANALGDKLNYQIYTDSSRSSVWDTSNTVNYSSNNLLARNFTVYGRIPAGQSNVNAGSYADVVTVTLKF